MAHIDQCDGYKTYRGARKKLDTASPLIGELTSFVVIRDDGTYVPVVVYNERKTTTAIINLVYAGLYVTT